MREPSSLGVGSHSESGWEDGQMAPLAMRLPSKHEERSRSLRSSSTYLKKAWHVGAFLKSQCWEGKADRKTPGTLWPAGLVCLELQTSAEVGGFSQTPEAVSFPLHTGTYMCTPHTPHRGPFKKETLVKYEQSARKTAVYCRLHL